MQSLHSLLGIPFAVLFVAASAAAQPDSTPDPSGLSVEAPLPVEREVRRVLDIQLGASPSMGANFCAELFLLPELSVEGCFETFLLVSAHSESLKYRFPVWSRNEGTPRRIGVGPLVGVRRRLAEFEGSGNLPWELEFGGSFEYSVFFSRNFGISTQVDFGAAYLTSWGGERAGLVGNFDLVARTSFGFAFGVPN